MTNASLHTDSNASFVVEVSSDSGSDPDSHHRRPCPALFRTTHNPTKPGPSLIVRLSVAGRTDGRKCDGDLHGRMEE